MSEEKICPMMSRPLNMFMCLRERCALWVAYKENGERFVEGHCGLIREEKALR